MAMKKKDLLIGVAFAVMALVSGCDGRTVAPPVAVVPPPAPPPPPPTGTSFSLTKCLSQTVGGRSVQDIVIPDQLVDDLSIPSSFPNGRKLDDPVIDLELAVLFLDLTKHPADTFVKAFGGAGVNPSNFDQPLRPAFPFFAAALGTPPLSTTDGANFNFRSDPAINYVRVDRMGLPAVATVTILSPRKNAYNDSSPAEDAAGRNVGDVVAGYQKFTDALNDDFKGLGLTPCAT